MYAFVRLRFCFWHSPLPRRLAEPAHTTRIETRPYYGAVVTIEHGVRVYRPVPPTQHLIVNPDGATPLQLNIGNGDAFTPTARPQRRTAEPVRASALEGAALRG